MVMIVDSQRQLRPAQHQATLPIRCKLFGPGREDWNRGLRELRCTIRRDGRLSRLADGTIRLHGLLGVDLRLNAEQVERIGQEGLQILSSELEVDIDAAAFAKALDASDLDGAVGLFRKDCYWRDLIAFTWNIKTLEGRPAIAEMLRARLADVKPSHWAIRGEATEAAEVAEGWFTFETAVARVADMMRRVTTTASVPSNTARPNAE